MFMLYSRVIVTAISRVHKVITQYLSNSNGQYKNNTL